MRAQRTASRSTDHRTARPSARAFGAIGARRRRPDRIRRTLFSVAALLALASTLVVVDGLATMNPAGAAAGDPFPAGSPPTVFISQGDPSTLYRAVTGGSGTTSFVVEGTPQNGVGYNALTFNPADRFLYAVVTTGNASFPAGSVIRIGQGNVFTRVGTGRITQVPPPNSPATPNLGAIDPATGTYYVAFENSTLIKTVSLSTGSEIASANLSKSATFADFTVKDGLLWAIDRDQTGDVVRIDPSTGTVTTFNTNLAIPGGAYGAAWTYGNGNLGFSNNVTGQVVQVAITNGASTNPTISVVRINGGPVSNINDGAAIVGDPVDLSVDKAGPATYTSGGSITYTLTVTNESSSTSSGWTLRDTLPAGTTFSSASSSTGTCSQAAGVVTCLGGTLAAGASATVTVTVTVTAPNASAGCLSNVASVLGNEADPVSANDQDSVSSCPQTAAITLDKTASRTTFTTVGQQVTYTMVATNESNVPLTNVTITDPHPGLSSLSCTPALGSTLAPDATMTCTGTYTTTQADIDAGKVSNTATTRGTPPSGANVTDTDSVDIAGPKADLDKAFSPASVQVGQTSTLTFTITNSPELGAKTDWYFSDQLPTNLIIASTPNVGGTCVQRAGNAFTVSAPAGGSFVTVSGGDLRAGDASCTVSLSVTSNNVGTYTNGPANITGIIGLTPPDDATVTFTSRPFDCMSLYGIDWGNNPHYIWKINPTTGAMTNLFATPTYSGLMNALAIDPARGTFWFTTQDTGGTTTIYSMDASTGVATNRGTVSLGGGSGSFNGTFDPKTNTYLFGSLSGTTGYVWGYNVVTGTYLGLLGTYAVPAGTNNVSDFALDATGRLYFTTDNSATGPRQLWATSLPVPTTPVSPVPTLALRKIADLASGPSNGSLAFGPDGYLYLGTTRTFEKLDPSSGASLGAVTMTPTSAYVGDFASCGGPGTVELRKSFPDGRIAAGDQVNLAITGGGLSVGNTATTTGSESGIQDQSRSEIAGPVAVLGGQTYTIAETAAGSTDLTRYTTAWSCTNQVDGQVLASGNGRSGQITIPSSTFGLAVMCTITNAKTPATPAIRVVKSAGTPADLDGNGVDAGDTLPYQFTVTNAGSDSPPDPLSNVSVTDPKCQTAPVYVSGDSNGDAILQGAETWVFRCSRVLTQADLDAGQVTNTATARGTGTAGGNVTDDDTVTTPLSSDAEITIDKTADRTTFSAVGQTITYTFVATNTGNVTLTNVRVTDPMTGLSALSCNPATPATLAPGASTTCTATYVTKQSDLDGNAVNNTASATGTPPTGPNVTDTDSHTVPGTQGPSIDIVKTASRTTFSKAGDVITYTFVATNTGNVSLTNVRVTDPLPGLSALSCTPATPVSLLPGASTTCTATYTVKQSDVDAGEVVNAATATGTPPTGPNVTDTDTETVDGTAAPSIEVVKTASRSTFSRAGDVITYTFVATNTGNTTLANVSVADPLPGLSNLTCSPAAPATLAPDASTTCTATYTVKQSDVDAGKVTNVATATGTPPSGPNVTDTDTETVDAAAGPAINVVKTASRTTFSNAGDVITYTFVATNTGNVTLTNVRVTDPLPGLSTLTCSPAAPATLLPGAATTCTATYTVKQSDVDAGSIVNVATATGTPPSGPGVTDTDTETVDGSSGPSIEVVKTASRSTFSKAGDVITYTFVATNTGNVSLTNVRVTDPLPGLSGVTCSPAAPATLVPGASTTCTATYTVKQSDVDAGKVTNVATATGTPPSGPGVTDTDTETVDGSSSPSIQVVKTASRSTYSQAGEAITYTFVATNTGNVSLSGVQVSDPLTGLSALSCSPATPTILAPGASTTCTATYTVKQSDVNAGEIVNVATATGTPPTGPNVTDTDTETVDGTAAPAIDIVKSASPGTYSKPGDVITYSFTATNTGNVSLSGVRITDPLPGLSALACSPAAPATLAPRASMSCAATYSVTQADIDRGSITNVAAAKGTPPSGPDVTAEDTETVTGGGTSGIDLIKSAQPVRVANAGDVVTYTFLATNTGSSTLSNVRITDPLPGLSALSCTPTAPATLLPGATLRCSASYTVKQSDVDAGKVANTAIATGVPPTGTPVTDEDTKEVPVTPTPAIDLAKTASRSTFTAVGQTIDYTFTATNSGNVSLHDVVIDDPLPGLSALSCTPDTPASLAPGAKVTCTARYTTTQADVDAGEVVNVAVATGTSPDDVDVTDEDTKTVDGGQAPGIDLVKTASPTTFTKAGETITYRFVATNTGNVTLDDVEVTDQLPGLSALSCTPGTPATLAPGAKVTCTATYTTTQADVNAGKVVNDATAEGTTPGGTKVSDDDTKTVTAFPNPAIDVVKTASPTTFDSVGDTITYRFTATNTGNVNLSGVSIDDPLPGLSARSCTPGAPAMLLPGATMSCTATYEITQADLDAGEVVNAATGTGTPPTGPPVVDTDTKTVTGAGAASIDVVKTSTSTGFAKAGDTITYGFTGTNTGTVTLDAVTITDPLPGLSALSCSPSAPATLAPGAKITCTASYKVTQADVDAGSVVNVATATGTPPSGPGVTDTDTHEVDGSATPGIDLVKSADTTSFTRAGETITYRLVATNTGTATLRNVTVQDPMVGLSTLDCAPAIPATLAPGAKVTCTATYTTTQADVDAGKVANVATATGTPPTGPPTTDTDDHTVPGTSDPSIDLLKTADRSSFSKAGDVITYSFVATNTGDVTLTNVKVTDPLPGLSALTCAPTTPATLAPGAKVRCTATYTVKQSDVDAGKVHNAATVTGTPPTGPPVGGGGEEEVPSTSSPAIDLDKSADTTSFTRAGETITYRLVATNTGNVTLTGVKITDPMAGLSTLNCAPAIPATLAPGAKVTCTATYKTTQADVDAGKVANAAAATGTPPTGPPVGGTDEHTVPADGAPAIDLSKTSDRTSYTAVGQIITYRFTAANTGDVTLTGVKITDPLPGLSALACAPAAPASLRPGQTMTCTATYAVRQADLDAGKVHNAATVTGTPPTGPPVGGGAEHEVPGTAAPALDLQKSADKTSFTGVGETITYRLVATNTGNVTLTGVKVTDPMAGLSALSCAPAIPATLAPGAKVTCTATYKTTQADVDAGKVANAAAATGTPPTGPPVGGTDEEEVPSTSNPDIDLQKTSDKTSFSKAGETITYRLVATNTGNVTLTGVKVTDPMAGLSALSCAPAIPATLAPGAKVTCTATYKTTQADVDRGKVANAAAATGTPPTGPPTTDEEEHTVPGTDGPALELTKVVDASSITTVGQKLTYTFVAENTGNVTLTGVKVTDPLPGLSALACTPAAPASLAPGSTMTCTATYTVKQSDVDAGKVHNVATATGTPPTGPPVETTDTETVNAPAHPALSMVKTADKATFTKAGEVLTYTFVTSNTGNVTLTGVRVSDPMPGLSALACAPSAPATLAPGATMTCRATYTTTSADVTAGKVRNAAVSTGTPPTGPPVETPGETEVPVDGAPAIRLEKTADKASFSKPGETITYRFLATNTGSVTMTGVRISDPLPGLSALSCTPAQPATLVPGGTLRCTATYKTTQADVDAGKVHNAATVTGTPPTGPPVDEIDEIDVPSNPDPDLSIVKTADVTTLPKAGDDITYTFVATNTGNVTLTGVKITDPLPGLSALDCEPAAPATLAPGKKMTCTATYTVTPADVSAGKVVNTATGTGTPPTGPPVDTTDTETVTNPGAAAIEVVKTADVDTFDVGDTITYRMVATNVGDVTLRDVEITDPLEGLAELSCDPDAPATLVPGASMTCTATYVATQADVDRNELENTATAVGTPPSGPDVTDEHSVTIDPGDTVGGQLDLEKTADRTTFRAGETVTYTFVATNTGSITLLDVVIDDPLPGLSALSCDPSAPAELAPGEKMTCRATYVVTPADVARGSIANAATASGSNPGIPPVNSTSNVTITMPGDPGSVSNHGSNGGSSGNGFGSYLPYTGSDTQQLVLIGVLLLALGGGLVAGATRRRRRTA